MTSDLLCIKQNNEQIHTLSVAGEGMLYPCRGRGEKGARDERTGGTGRYLLTINAEGSNLNMRGELDGGSEKAYIQTAACQ